MSPECCDEHDDAEKKKINNDTSNFDDHENEEDDSDNRSCTSADEALLELLGLQSMNNVKIEDEDDENNNHGHDNVSNNDKTMTNATATASSSSSQLLHPFTPCHLSDDDEELRKIVIETSQLHIQYKTKSVCICPNECSIPATYMRRLANELIWSSNHNVDSNNPHGGDGGGGGYYCDKTYETIQVLKSNNGEIEHRRVLTRCERFVDTHPGWSDLCHGYLRKLVSFVVGEEMVLYKEKLNLKPPGGSGFAPHLDTPSLRVVSFGGSDCNVCPPQTFVTVMVAIDDMTIQNGCLRVVTGRWDENNHVTVIEPPQDGNPDGNGRAGAIPDHVLNDDNSLEFEDIVCKGGTVVVFDGWVPHRSSANTSPFPRRAVFLTYNPLREGDFHTKYYERMDELRNTWRNKIGLQQQQYQQCAEDEEIETRALATIPT